MEEKLNEEQLKDVEFEVSVDFYTLPIGLED